VDPERSKVKWTTVAPIALVAVALAVVLWLEFGYPTDSEPAPLLGTVGTPVRGTYVPPTALPTRDVPTPGPRPTPEGVTGTPGERDVQRRSDLLILVWALEQYAGENGSFPPTGGNLQTLCAFEDVDAGCQLSAVLDTDVPVDPIGAPHENGYWYQSDGSSATIYVSFEEEVQADRLCESPDPGLRQKSNLICVRLP
jgi:hypothetical protein